LVVYPDKMYSNLMILKGLNKSQSILLALINKGMLRQKAYLIVQKCSKEALKNNYSFEDILKKNSVIKKYLSKKDIGEFFKNDDISKNINWIYKKKFK